MNAFDILIQYLVGFDHPVHSVAWLCGCCRLPLEAGR